MPAPGFETYGEPTSYDGESTSAQNISNRSQEQPAQRYSYEGPDVNLMNLEWRTINGPFVSIWLQNVPWGSEDSMAAPDAKVGISCNIFGMHKSFCGILLFFFFSSPLFFSPSHKPIPGHLFF